MDISHTYQSMHDEPCTVPNTSASALARTYAHAHADNDTGAHMHIQMPTAHAK